MSDDILAVLQRQSDLSKIKLIGKGGASSVYKAIQQSTAGEKSQIVRVISDIRNHHSIKREKDLLNYLNQFSDFFHFNEIRKVGLYYLQFFDYKSKFNLKQQIKKKGPLSSTSTKTLLVNMISTLDKVHKVGFVHGDIKPTNIVVSAKQYFLIDWTQSIPFLSSFDAEIMVGDKRYSPPERLNGLLDEKSDIYSLGCTLYYALTGKHIYRLDKVEDTNLQLWAQVHHSIHKLNTVPVLWRNLIVWMTQKEPLKRPSLLELQKWLEGGPIPKWVLRSLVESEQAMPADPIAILASENYLYPIFRQALMYEDEGNLSMAFKLYERCALRGYSRAENNLGLMYERGKSVKPSYTMAISMYQRAVKKGNPFAANNLARLSEKGIGMPINLGQAYKLHKFAALRGNLKSQNSLGLMYQKGSGMNVNLSQARFWFDIAATHRNK
ncbi:Sel1-like repeat-containing protein kinase family protein [Thiomicrorhabdus arctica]|uniref:Sel1-like repeat-containing protein kinase family protein n=1 Tax=Thiomicrorhabdus arctica TaxID=131540 RepID=UPI00037E4426|nr:Sel1-like repeat-containing protein kinase family protein [Thiomicrorhabdus arctica]